jgi:hypothetical protein
LRHKTRRRRAATGQYYPESFVKDVLRAFSDEKKEGVDRGNIRVVSL